MDVWENMAIMAQFARSLGSVYPFCLNHGTMEPAMTG